MSYSYGELQNTSSLLPEPQIDVPAFFVPCKQLYSFTFIAIDFPASGAFKIPARIFNKANHVSKRIIKKNPDLMREAFTFQIA